MEEIFTVFAVRELNFKDDNGKEIRGTVFYMGQSTSDRGWLGTSCEKFFVPFGFKFSHFPVSGETVLVRFNRFGKIVDIFEV